MTHEGRGIALLVAGSVLVAHAGAARADTPVVVTTEGSAATVYVAPGADVTSSGYPDPFKKAGVTAAGQPLQLSLPPGPYTFESEGATTSSGHDTVVVGGEPTRVDVRQGDATVKGLGTIFMGLGVSSVIAGIVALLSLPTSTEHFNKYVIGGALIGGGVAGFGLGLGLTFAGRTRITVVPMGAAGAAPDTPH